MSSKDTSNSSILMSMRLKKKPKAVEPLPELGDDIADDHALNTYRPGISVDDAPNSDNNSGTMKKSTLSKKKDEMGSTPFSLSNQTSTLKNTCACCTRPLVRKDKAGIVNYNFPRCKVCYGKICRNCLDKGYCHECIVRDALKTKMIPDLLLKIDRVSLLGYIEMLHYPMDVMKGFDNKHLVKQLLVRFNCGSDWDPKFHSDSADAIDGKDQRKHSFATSSDSDHKGNIADANVDKDLTDKIDAEFEQRLRIGAGTHTIAKDNVSQLDSHEVVFRHPYDDVKRDMNTAKKFREDITIGLKESLKDKLKREGSVTAVKPNTSFNLLDIKSPAYFDSLSAPELRAILNQHSVTVNPDLEKHQLQFSVLQLWNNVKEQAAMAPTPQMPMPSKTSHEITMLHDISSIDLLEDLSTNQMVSLMVNHGKSLNGKITRNELLYELKRMWQEMQSYPYRPLLQQPVQERILSLNDIRSASDIEKLSTHQLRGILINNDIDPKSYSEVHEMKYMIRQLWYRTQLKDNVRATLNRSIDAPKTFNDHHRSSMRAPNLSGSKSMNQLDRLDDQKPSGVKFNPFSKAPAKTNIDFNKRSRDDSIETDSWQYQRREPYVRQMSMPMLAITLEEIRHPDDIQELNLHQLKHILKSRNIDISRMSDKAELAYHVKELWMAKKAQESEIERRNGHTNNYNKSAFVPVNHSQVPIGIELGLPLPNTQQNFDQYQSSTLQRVISLQDITKPELIATLSTLQMKTLLEKYKIHVSDPKDKAALMELTRRLWTQRNGEIVVNYMTLPQAQEASPVYAKITPSALRKSFRSEEQLRRMEQPNSPIESETINRNSMQLVEVRAGEIAVSQKPSRNSGIWKKEEDFRTSSPITALPAPTQNNISDVVNEIASIQSLEDIRSIQIIPRLTIRQMKYILSKHEVDFAGCSEKKEFEIHLGYLWKKNRNKKYPNY